VSGPAGGPGGEPEPSHRTPVVRGAGRRLVSFLRSHPILCLAILTPGLPEYLSTSSSLLNLGLNPLWFFLQLAINIAQYTGGALLVREAMIRWNKGWASVILLGAAYGIVEEGLGDSTLVNSSHGADGALGWFGRYAGVNWVWSTGVIAFHIIFSIGLPILLLGLALPATRGRSLIGRRGIAAAFASVLAATLLENRIVFSVDHFWMGYPLLAAGLGLIAALVALAYFLPRTILAPNAGPPTLSAGAAAVLGFVVFPIAFALEYGFTSTAVPPALLIGVEVVVFALLLEIARRGVGQIQHEYVLVNLAFGFVLWQSVFGILLTLGFPYTLPLVAIAVLFFVRLRRRYRADRPVAVPTGASGA
jgi:hypothetical protein